MTVKSTNICGQNRWFGKLICLGLLISVYRCYVPLLFQQNNGCLWRLPRHLKVAKTLELPGVLPPGSPPGPLPLDPTGTLKRAPGPHAQRGSARFALMDTTLWPPQSLLPCYAPALVKSCSAGLVCYSVGELLIFDLQKKKKKISSVSELHGPTRHLVPMVTAQRLSTVPSLSIGRCSHEPTKNFIINFLFLNAWILLKIMLCKYTSLHLTLYSNTPVLIFSLEGTFSLDK